MGQVVGPKHGIFIPFTGRHGASGASGATIQPNSTTYLLPAPIYGPLINVELSRLEEEFT
jgi:hypothetical protein